MHMEVAGDSRFWDQYIEVLQVAAIPEKARRWYVVRVERYLAMHPQPDVSTLWKPSGQIQRKPVAARR